MCQQLLAYSFCGHLLPNTGVQTDDEAVIVDKYCTLMLTLKCPYSGATTTL